MFPIEIEKHERVPFRQINASLCSCCNHIFLNEINEETNKKIYSDYYYLYPFNNLESMNSCYRIPFEEFFKYIFNNININRAELLEIGCSNSNQLDIFNNYGFNCTGISPGIEPSDKFKMIDDYYEKHIFSEKFDVIVSRFNLEHIIDLDVFINKTMTDLNDNGKLVIQVPNVDFFLNCGVLNIFAHEHVHYFCSSSITALFERMNYSIEACNFSQTPSLILTVGKRVEKYNPNSNITKNFETIEQIKRLIIAHNGRVIFYGAGLSLAAILYEIDRDILTKKEIIIFDDNPILNNLVMPGTTIKIINYDPQKITKNTLFFLTLSSIYHKKIINKMDTNSCRIIAINNKGLFEV